MNGEEQRLVPDEALRRRNLALYESIYHVRIQPAADEAEHYRMEEARSGALVLCHKEGDKWLPWNSLYDPSYEAGRWAESIEMPDRQTILAILCFRMGYELAALMQRFRPDTQYYIYEPDEAQFAFICGFMDLTPILTHPSIMLFTPSYPDGGFRHFMGMMPVIGNTSALAVPLPGAPDDDTYYSACAQIVISATMNANFQYSIGRLSFINRMHSWVRLHRNALLKDLMDRLPRELPVIVVAAGPSLNKNVELLKDVYDRALIVCTDRAAGALAAHGVQPHLLITVDVDKDTGYVQFEELEQVPMIASFQINPSTQAYADGRLIYFHALWHEEELPGLSGRLIQQGDLGGNVATAAYASFAQMGFQNVILIGQDLAMLGNQHHADDRAEGLFDPEQVIEVEGIDGKMVQSHLDWINFRDNYEMFIKGFPDTHCVDATEGGALIHGSEVLTLREAICRYCSKTYDIKGMLSDLPRAQTMEEHEATLEMLSGWVDELDQFVETGEEIRELLEQLLRIARYHDITDPKHAKKLAKLDELRASIIDRELAGILRTHWIRSKSIIPDRSYMLRNNEEAIPVLEHAIRFYEELPENCRSLQEAIRTVLNEASDDGKKKEE